MALGLQVLGEEHVPVHLVHEDGKVDGGVDPRRAGNNVVQPLHWRARGVVLRIQDVDDGTRVGKDGLVRQVLPVDNHSVCGPATDTANGASDA